MLAIIIICTLIAERNYSTLQYQTPELQSIYYLGIDCKTWNDNSKINELHDHDKEDGE